MLPHFHKFNIKNMVPIYNNLFEVDFKNKYLMETCFSIEDDIMKFSLNVTDKSELQPFKYINDMIINNIIIKYLKIIYHDKNGDVVYCIFLKNFQFIKTNILDFDWSDTIIKQLYVKFKYDSSDLVMNKNYNNFLRKIKLEQITEKES